MIPPKDLYVLAFLAFLAGCGGRSHEPAVEGPGVVAGSGGLGNAGGAAAGGCRFSCRCIGTDGGFVWHCIQPAC